MTSPCQLFSLRAAILLCTLAGCFSAVDPSNPKTTSASGSVTSSSSGSSSSGTASSSSSGSGWTSSGWTSSGWTSSGWTSSGWTSSWGTTSSTIGCPTATCNVATYLPTCTGGTLSTCAILDPCTGSYVVSTDCPYGCDLEGTGCAALPDSGASSCTADSQCGSGAYCAVPMTTCPDGLGFDVTVSLGTCHRSCQLQGACLCQSDADCPAGTCANGACQWLGGGCPPITCAAGCALTHYAEDVCPVCVCAVCPASDCSTSPCGGGFTCCQPGLTQDGGSVCVDSDAGCPAF